MQSSLLANFDLVAESRVQRLPRLSLQQCRIGAAAIVSADLGADVTASLDLVRSGLAPLV